MSTSLFQKRKLDGKKITMLTCYDYTSAKIISETNIDSILVGDSLAMTMLGNSSTLPATTEVMAIFTKAVVQGAKNKFIIADMPFLSYRKGVQATLAAAALLMEAGAHAVKLEGIDGHEEDVRFLVESGIPVMGHLGLTPQSIHQLGGYKVQGREERAAAKLMEQALKLESLGCFSLVLECVPTAVADQITRKLHIPTIGIGAGSVTDGQVLVFQDLLGLNPDFKPRFVRTFTNGSEIFKTAINSYDQAVKEHTFPNLEESYT